MYDKLTEENDLDEEDRYHSNINDREPLISDEKPTRDAFGETRTERVFFFSTFGLLQAIGIVCLILAIIWAKVYMHGFSWNGSGTNFNWHIVFMTMFIYLYGNAAIVYRVTRNMDKYSAKLIHGGVNLLAFIFAVLGLVAVFRFHNVNSIPNVYSLHSWVGIATIALYACQLGFGFASFLFPRISNDNMRGLYLEVHVFFGVAMLALVVVAAASGITEKMLFAFKPQYSKFVPVGYVANFFGVFIGLFVLMVSYVLYNSRWKRVR